MNVVLGLLYLACFRFRINLQYSLAAAITLTWAIIKVCWLYTMHLYCPIELSLTFRVELIALTDFLSSAVRIKSGPNIQDIFGKGFPVAKHSISLECGTNTKDLIATTFTGTGSAEII